MAKKERTPEPLDVLSTMVAFLNNGNGLPKRGINFENKIVMTQEEIEKFCEEYNRKIARPEIGNTK